VDSQPSVHHRCNAVVFTTGGHVCNVWLAPRVGQPAENLDVTGLFPNGALSTRITSVPGTSLKAMHDYRVFASNRQVPAPDNAAIAALYGQWWPGNLVFAKYDRFLPTTLVDIPAGELEFIYHFAGM